MEPIQAPTLDLTGARDGCITPEIVRAAMPPTLFPRGATIETWLDAGQFLHLERPTRAARRIIAWLQSVETGQA